jgi:hypothetical protein
MMKSLSPIQTHGLTVSNGIRCEWQLPVRDYTQVFLSIETACLDTAPDQVNLGLEIIGDPEERRQGFRGSQRAPLLVP